MKNKKLLLGIICGLVFVLFAIFVIYIIKEKTFDESDYITKGQYFERFIEENNLYSDVYSDEEIENAENYNIVANIMVEWNLITEKQAKNPEKPLTKEIVAQTIINFMPFRQTHNVKIKDIDKCYDKQAIMDAVGMGLFQLDNGRFNPKSYITYSDIDNIFEKQNEIVGNIDFNKKEQDAKIDWSEVAFIIYGKEYKYPFKVSDFVNNGWESQAPEFQEILNKIIDENFLPNGDSDIYIGYNYVGLKQNDLIAYVYFDTSIMNTRVLDAKVTSFEIETTNKKSEQDFNFYGINFGDKKEKIEELFGTKNYEVSNYKRDNYYSYRYYHDTTGNQVIFYLDKKNNEVYKISIGLYK